jgi:hypothetical protein
MLYRIDPRTGTVTMTVNNPDLHNAMPAVGLAGGAGQLWLYGVGGPDAVWVADPARGRLLRVDPWF